MHAAATNLHVTVTVPTLARRIRRRAVATAIVAGIYVLLTAATPWLVRYGADIAPAATIAAQSAPGAFAPRCATAADSGHACSTDDASLD